MPLTLLMGFLPSNHDQRRERRARLERNEPTVVTWRQSQPARRVVDSREGRAASHLFPRRQPPRGAAPAWIFFADHQG